MRSGGEVATQSSNLRVGGSNPSERANEISGLYGTNKYCCFPEIQLGSTWEAAPSARAGSQAAHERSSAAARRPVIDLRRALRVATGCART
jgi:hypothetical protein